MAWSEPRRRSPPLPGGGVGRAKWQQRPPPAARVCARKLWSLLLQGAQPEAAPRGCSADASREQLVARQKVSCERPPAAEVRGAQWHAEGWVGLSGFWRPPLPTTQRPRGVSSELSKLLQTDRRGDLHSAGSQSGRVWPGGNAGRADQPATRNFPAKPPRRTALCLRPSTAHVGVLLC